MLRPIVASMRPRPENLYGWAMRPRADFMIPIDRIAREHSNDTLPLCIMALDFKKASRSHYFARPRTIGGPVRSADPGAAGTDSWPADRRRRPSTPGGPGAVGRGSSRRAGCPSAGSGGSGPRRGEWPDTGPRPRTPLLTSPPARPRWWEVRIGLRPLYPRRVATALSAPSALWAPGFQLPNLLSQL